MPRRRYNIKVDPMNPHFVEVMNKRTRVTYTVKVDPDYPAPGSGVYLTNVHVPKPGKQSTLSHFQVRPATLCTLGKY